MQMKYSILFLSLFSMKMHAADQVELNNATLIHTTQNKIKSDAYSLCEYKDPQRPFVCFIIGNVPEHFAHQEGNLTKIYKRKFSVFTTGTTAFSNPPKTNTTQKSCSTVDLSSKLGPVRDQVGGSCYAYTATDLLSFGETKQYSAFHLATQFKGKEDDSKTGLQTIEQYKAFTGGFISEAMKIGLDRGLCPEDTVYSDKHNHSIIGHVRDHSAIAMYYGLTHQTLKPLDKDCGLSIFNHPLFNDSSQISAHLRSVAPTLIDNRDRIIESANYVYPKLSKTTIKDALEKSTNVMNFFRKLNLLSCESHLRRIPPNKTTQNVKDKLYPELVNNQIVIFDDNRIKMINNINDLLSKEKPVGFSYKSEGLLFPKSSGLHANHASTIAGRRWKAGINGKPGECIYLVKNSWGEDWTPTQGTKASPSKHPGYFEITEKQLMEHTLGVTYLD
jgi:hypothetical protein